MILLVDNYDSFTYNLYHQIKVLEDDVQVVRNDRISVDAVMALKPQGIVLSPGPGRPEQAGLCIELIQRCYTQIPILGVCLGHQAIAAAFGARIVPATTMMHGKTSEIHCQPSALFHGLPTAFTVGRYHSLMVQRTSLPRELTITAETTDGTIMALEHQHHRVFGVQFHPESILSDGGQHCIHQFITLCQEKIQ